MKFKNILKYIEAKKGLYITFNYKFAYIVIKVPIEEKQLSVKV